MTAKKCTKKRDARAELLFCFFHVLIAVAVVVAYAPWLFPNPQKQLENRQWKTFKCFSNLVDLVSPLFACFSQIKAYLIYFRVIHYIFSLICESQRVQRLIVTRSRWWNSSEHNCSTVSTKTIFQYPGQRLQQKEKISITDLRHFYTIPIPDSSYAHTKTITKRAFVHTQERWFRCVLLLFVTVWTDVFASGRSGSK